MEHRRPCLTLALTLAMAAWQPARAQLAPAAAPPQTRPQPATQTPPAAKPGTAASGDEATATAAAAGASTAQPEGKRYFVEIVVFRAQVALGTAEDWPAEAGMATTVTGGETPSGSGVGQLIDLLPSSQYHLTSIAEILRRSRTYSTVAHAAWEQTASAWGTHAGFTLQQLGIEVPGLTGQVYLERGQYLHLGMTLDYTEQHPPAGLGAAPGTTFVLNETRRVRYYRRNYYDNPAFGVIALVLPVAGSQPPGR